MTPGFSTKLKRIAKRCLGSGVYSFVYNKNKIQKRFKKIRMTEPSSRRPNAIMLTIKKWRVLLLIILFIFGTYYGIGATVSSNINNRLNADITAHRNQPTTINALSYVLKTQVDEQPWTPALPIIFPASILDNMPNFQIGAKESANYFLKKFAKRYQNEALKEAGELLDYPSNIWLFSQTKDDKMSPGSAKQYRKALAKIEKAVIKEQTEEQIRRQDFLYFLKGANNLLKKQISTLNKHVLEHESEILDFNADDIFYRAEGTVYTLHYMLSAIAKDYQKQILESEQYENLTTALKFLADANALAPISIKNAAPNDIYAANHLLYLAFYLSQTQLYLQKIYYANLSKTKEQPQ